MRSSRRPSGSPCELFGADHAYVQPHSGADANLVAFLAILAARVETPVQAGARRTRNLRRDEWDACVRLGNQRLLAMDYYSGGHLTHGYRHNSRAACSSRTPTPSTVRPNLVDLDALARKRCEVGRLSSSLATAPIRARLTSPHMREIADEVGAVFMVDMAHFAGLVAGKVFEGDYNPVAHAHVVTTTTHKTLRGPRGGFVLCTRSSPSSSTRAAR